MLHVIADSRKTFASRLVSALMATILATATTAQASPESDLVANLVNGHKYMRLSGAVIEGDAIKKLYDAFGDQPLWVTNGQINAQGAVLRDVFMHADRQGLDIQDYWTPTLEALSKTLSPTAWLSYEMAASNSLLKYAHDLSSGRAEPNLIDDDIRFTRKPLDVGSVITAIQSGNLAASLDNLAPKMLAYQRLQGALAKILQDKTSITPIAIAKRDLNVGDNDESLIAAKRKLRAMGYSISEDGPSYTQELAQAVLQFEDDSNLDSSTKILASGAFWKRMNTSADDRIRSIQLSMEKLRWLPQNLEQRHVFVNLALSQFRLYENNKLVMGFRTVNGQPIRRTQSMRDYIAQIEMNPDWGVPTRNAIKDKLPALQKDPNYLVKNNLMLVDKNTDRVASAPMFGWGNVSKTDFPYTIIQKPGYDSALGVMKFVMATNDDAIYLHDTNERELFAESARLKSSGCVRLQKPMDFASYLLKDNAQWPESRWRPILYTPDEPQGDGGIKPERLMVNLTDKIYVYLMYLTAEVDDVGHLRFADDAYHQDERLAKAIWGAKLQWSGAGQNLGAGYIQVNGQAGPTQLSRKVIAYRCNTARRGACDAPVSFELNAQTQVPAGQYIVGFENSINPGFVEVQAGRITTINMQAVQLPSALQRSKATIKVYRALDDQSEQTKFLWAFNQLGGRMPFALSVYNFGDLYVAANGEHDQVGRMNYDVCAVARGGGTVEAQEFCGRYTSAHSEADIAENFRFLGKGFGDMNPKYVKAGYMEMELPINAATVRADVTKIQFPRQLVAAPMSGSDTILLFPGVYSAVGTGVGPVNFQVGSN